MLSLQTLPVEIILMIAQYVGSAYLRARVERILLCKAWYSVTQSVAWEDVALSISNFEKFLQAPNNIQTFLQAPNNIQTFIQSRLKALSISGAYDTDPISPSATQAQTLETESVQSDTLEACPVAKVLSLLRTRNTTLCTALMNFSTATLPRLKKLQTFALNISSQSTTIYTETDNSWSETLRLLTTSLPHTLTSLTIDKLGPTSRFRTGMQDPHAVCKILLAKDHLPALRHLRLRIHCICPELFLVKSTGTHLSLETIVVALDAYSPQLGAVHNAYCCTQPQLSSQRLFDDMVEAAHNSIKNGSFPALKTARILRYDVEDLVLYSLDVLSGKSIEVPQTVEWDDVSFDDRIASDADEEAPEESGLDLLDGCEREEVADVLPSLPVSGVQVHRTLTINITNHA